MHISPNMQPSLDSRRKKEKKKVISPSINPLSQFPLFPSRSQSPTSQAISTSAFFHHHHSLLQLPPHNPSLPHGAHDAVSPPQQFLQSSLRRIFLRRIHVLPVIPVASRDREPGDGDVAGPGGALASTVGEDFVLRGREVTLGAVG